MTIHINHIMERSSKYYSIYTDTGVHVDRLAPDTFPVSAMGLFLRGSAAVAGASRDDVFAQLIAPSSCLLPVQNEEGKVAGFLSR